jgi:TolA-binding protein
MRGRPPRVASKIPSETASPDVAEQFDGAMQLYRAHRYAESAAAFHNFASSHGGAGEEEDAAFLEAISLARASRVDAAAFAAESFLERFPRSFHGKDAAILVARGARDRGDCEKARAVLERWLRGAPSAGVTAALGRCSP